MILPLEPWNVNPLKAGSVCTGEWFWTHDTGRSYRWLQQVWSVVVATGGSLLRPLGGRQNWVGPQRELSQIWKRVIGDHRPDKDGCVLAGVTYGMLYCYFCSSKHWSILVKKLNLYFSAIKDFKFLFFFFLTWSFFNTSIFNSFGIRTVKGDTLDNVVFLTSVIRYLIWINN